MGARGSNPYVGLRPFVVDDSHLFFGRRAQTNELLEDLYRHRFLGVVGSSGCGKSSLINAGLIPALRGGFLIEDRDQWSIARLTPGDGPLENLARAVSEALGVRFDVAGLRQEIQSDGIEPVCDRILGSMTQENNLLVIVDQFEEIFAFRGRSLDPGEDGLAAESRKRQFQRQAEAADFVSVLLALTRRPGAPIYVVLTMRSDFLGDCDIFYGLPEAMNQGRYLVPRLTRKQLEEAILGPAKFFGAEISKPLLDRLLNELGDRFDRLPVLQHALLRTWEIWSRKSEGPIDIIHYVKAGTLEGALGIHAKELLDTLAADLQVAPDKREEFERTVAGVFQSLTDTDTAGRQVRRPAGLRQIAGENGLEAEQVRQILKPFVDAGFLYAVVEAADERYALSHESLIRQWDRLKGWVAEERESRDNYLELVHFAAGEKRDERGLLRNPDLHLKRRWWARKNPRFEWARRYREKEEEFREAKRYLERSRRYQLFRWALGLVSVVAVIAVLSFATISANRLRARAEEGERNAAASATEASSARDQAETNLKLAKDSETSAKRSSDEADKARVKAEGAEKVATQRLFDSQVANITSRLDSQDPALRDSLWALATGNDNLREQVLRRVVGSEAAAGRFVSVRPLVMNSLLEANPKERISPLRRVAGECADRIRSLDRDRAVAEACATLVRELGVAGLADKEFGARAAILLQETPSPTALQVLGSAVSDQDLPKLSKAILTQGSNNTINSLETELEFLVTFGNRIPGEERSAIVNDIVSRVKIDRNEYVLTDARMEALSGMLNPEAARRMAETIPMSLVPLVGTPLLPLPTARILSWLAKYLTDIEGGTVVRALMNNLITLRPGTDQEQLAALKRLSEDLAPNHTVLYTFYWVIWVSNWDPAAAPVSDEVLSVAFNALHRVRGGIDQAFVKQMFKARVSDAPVGQARTRLRLIAAIGGLDMLAELKPDVLDKWLDAARFEYDYASSPLTALDREVISKVGSLKIAPGAGAMTGTSQRYSAGQQWLIRGMEPTAWAAFLNSVPRSSEGLDMLITLLEQVDREQASQVLERILQHFGASGFERWKISNLSWAVDRIVNRDPFHKLALPKLTSYLLGLMEGSSEDARLEAAQALADLNLPLTPAQRTRVSRTLIRGVESPERGAEYAGAVASFHNSLTATESARVVEVLYRRFGQAQAGGYGGSALLPLARMAPFLTATQTQAILKILPRDPDGLWNNAKVITALVPALDSAQVETILSGLQSRLLSYGSAMPGGLAATLAAKLPPDRRRLFVQSIMDAPDKRRERPSLTEANLLWSLWAIMEPTQRERAFRLILQAVAGDTSGTYGDRQLPDFVRAAASVPGGNERLKTALLQTLENRRPGQIGFQNALRIIHELDGREFTRQELLNILKWPTLQPWAQQELIAVLTKDGSAPPGKFMRARSGSDAQYDRLYRNDAGVEIDWWSVSKWAAARGLDLSPPTHPVGYQ